MTYTNSELAPTKPEIDTARPAPPGRLNPELRQQIRRWFSANGARAFLSRVDEEDPSAPGRPRQPKTGIGKEISSALHRSERNTVLRPVRGSSPTPPAPALALDRRMSSTGHGSFRSPSLPGPLAAFIRLPARIRHHLEVGLVRNRRCGAVISMRLRRLYQPSPPAVENQPQQIRADAGQLRFSTGFLLGQVCECTPEIESNDSSHQGISAKYYKKYQSSRTGRAWKSSHRTTEIRTS